MSCNYADGLSPYENKGKLGLAEKFDSKDEVIRKVKTLTEWLLEAKHVVVHTGAGISTTAGIPDFRGPNGVWTLEAKGEKPDINISFNDATPTKTHMSLVKLLSEGKIHYVVSQNIDGLHLRSGIPRSNLAELHGNMFVEQCAKCSRQFVRCSATSSVGKKCLQKPCPTSQMSGRPCRGRMHDVILDWEHDLPERDLGLADFHSCVADLSICLGTTLQIIPSGNLPLHTKKYGQGGRLVICNLQPTKHDKKADLLIHTYVDDIMSLLMENLGLSIPDYTRDKDPTYHRGLLEWTIPSFEVQRMRRIYEQKCCKLKRSKVKNDLEDFKGVKKIKLQKSESKISETKIDISRESNAIDGSNIKTEIKKSEDIKEEPLEISDTPKTDEQKESSIKCEIKTEKNTNNESNVLNNDSHDDRDNVVQEVCNNEKEDSQNISSNGVENRNTSSDENTQIRIQKSNEKKSDDIEFSNKSCSENNEDDSDSISSQDENRTNGDNKSDKIINRFLSKKNPIEGELIT